MGKRKTYHITCNKKVGGWNVKSENTKKPVSTHKTKENAVEAGKKLAKKPEKGQIVIHKKDGTIQTEHTYGKDPHPPKG